MKCKICLATLFLLSAVSLGAISAEATPPSAGSPATRSAPGTPAPPATSDQPAPIFDALDTNHDGYVTKEEAKRSADVTARFKELDTDHDGRTSASEFARNKM